MQEFPNVLQENDLSLTILPDVFFVNWMLTLCIRSSK